MNKAEYAEYLETSHWKKTRAEARVRADGRCQLCNRTKRLHVHHRTYERLGAELPGDLTVLCEKCHNTFHKERTVKGTQSKATKPARRQPYSKRHRAILAAIEELTPGYYTTADIAVLAGVSASSCGGILAGLTKRSEVPLARSRKVIAGRKKKWERTAGRRAGDSSTSPAESELVQALDHALQGDNWQDRRAA